VNGWITRVDFYLNGSLVNTDTAGPWSFNVSGLANGTYTLTAKAVDQLSAETTSAPITITVGAQPTLHFVHVDHLNTPRLVASQSGQTVWRWDQQEPFGDSVPDENPSGLGIFDLPLRLPGQYFDKETGLHYNYYRDYDPSLGIYKQSDLIGLQGGVNTYAYVRSRPIESVDPLGLFEIPWPFLQAGAGGGFQLLLAGGSFSCGGVISLGGQACRYCTVCARLGPGLFIGAGGTVGGGIVGGNASNLGGYSIGVGGDVGFNASAGASAGLGVSGNPFQGNIGGLTSALLARARGGVGYGAGVGIEICKTEIKCTSYCWSGTQ
jgi:RHS repeat-associated protein